MTRNQTQCDKLLIRHRYSRAGVVPSPLVFDRASPQTSGEHLGAPCPTIGPVV